MGVPTIDTGPMTVEDFYALTDSRPDNEKWELIEGDPVLNAWPTYRHQRIVMNVVQLMLSALRERPDLEVLAGLSVRTGPNSLPVPDILVRPRVFLPGRECDDMIVAFEILSPSTVSHDLQWKRAAYTKLPSLAHYVVIAQDTVEVVIYDRSSGFQERRISDEGTSVEILSPAISLPLKEIYQDANLS